MSTVAVIAFVLGFPVAMFLAWTFDLTTEGLERTPVSSRRGKATLLGALVLLLAGTAGLFLLIRPGLESQVERPGAVSVLPNSIAVLPFENTGQDPGDAYLSDGLSDELRDQLSGVPGIRVAARSSSVAAREQGLDAQTASQKLGVASLVEVRDHAAGQSVQAEEEPHRLRAVPVAEPALHHRLLQRHRLAVEARRLLLTRVASAQQDHGATQFKIS